MPKTNTVMFISVYHYYAKFKQQLVRKYDGFRKNDQFHSSINCILLLTKTIIINFVILITSFYLNLKRNCCV